jgi:hypothetical protein
MKTWFRYPVAVLIVFAIVSTLLAGGCASVASPSLSSDRAASDAAAREAPRAASGAVAPQAVAPKAGAAASAPGAPPATTGDTTMSLDRMIIRTANLVLVVGDVEAAIGNVRDITQGVGGFIAKSNTRYEGELMLADLTIQIPANFYDATIQRLRGVAVRVDSENSGTQDVTEEYADLDAQMRNLQATETSLLKLMDRATQVADILTIQRELTNVRGQIERAQGRMKFLSRKSDMSTINISLIPEAKSKKKPQPGWDPLGALRDALGGSADMYKGLAVGLIYFFVYTLPLWIIVALVIWFIRRRTGRRPPTPPVPPIPPVAS